MTETTENNKYGHTECQHRCERRTLWKHLNLPSDRAQTESERWMYIRFRRRGTHRYARRNVRPRHRRNRTDQRYDTALGERIKSQYTRRTIGNLSHSNSGRSTGAHAHHRYDGKHRTKEQHLLLSGNGGKS